MVFPMILVLSLRKIVWLWNVPVFLLSHSVFRPIDRNNCFNSCISVMIKSKNLLQSPTWYRDQDKVLPANVVGIEWCVCQ